MAERGERRKVPGKLTWLSDELHSECNTAVLQRARGITNQWRAKMRDLYCLNDPEADRITLSASVRGTTSPSSNYTVQATVDMGDQLLLARYCSCPAFAGADSAHDRGYRDSFGYRSFSDDDEIYDYEDADYDDYDDFGREPAFGHVDDGNDDADAYQSPHGFDRRFRRSADGRSAGTGSRYTGMCKHLAAMIMLFVQTPERFHGYQPGNATPRYIADYMRRIDAERHTSNKDSRLDLLKRIANAKQRLGEEQGWLAPDHHGKAGGSHNDGPAIVLPGSVHLEPTITLTEGTTWSLSLRIGHGNTSYVLKNISRFVSNMRTGAYESYGRKLAFTHTPDMLDQFSQSVLTLLNRVLATRAISQMQNRYSYGDAVTVQRDLLLTDWEVCDLLDLHDALPLPLPNGEASENTHAMETDDIAGPAQRKPTSIMVASGLSHAGELNIIEGNPAFGFNVSYERHGEDRGIRIIADKVIMGTVTGQHSRYMICAQTNGYADTALYRCSAAMEPAFGPLSSLCVGDPDGVFIAEEDWPMFARTILPALADAGIGLHVPQEVAYAIGAECRIEYYLDRDLYGVTCEVVARYGDFVFQLVPAAKELRGVVNPDSTSKASLVKRDQECETLAVQVARQLFPTWSATNPARVREEDEDAILLLITEGVEILKSMGQVFSTAAFDGLMSPSKPSVKVGLSVESNLVEISPIADEVPMNEVGALLDSYRRRRRYHRLHDGTFVDLRDADLGELDRIASDLDLTGTQLDGGTIAIPGYQAFLLDAQVPDERKNASFTSYVNDVKVIDPSRYEVPQALRNVLRPYQEEGFRWLSTLWDKGFGGILADEMGLGKSVQLLALVEARKGNGPTLIVCPASLVYNWAAECEKFTADLTVEVVAGTKTERRNVLRRLRAMVESESSSSSVSEASSESEDGPDILITSYDLLRRDIAEYAGCRFACMVLDEAQYIKNHATKVAKVVKQVNAAHRFALTGTPIENRLSELWSIFDFLMPGLLGTYTRFRERYEQPILAPGPEQSVMADKLRALVGLFIKRRLKKDVLTDLPDKFENVVTVKLAGEQRKLYAAHEQRLRAALTKTRDADFNTSRIRILAEFTLLRELCCDPRLVYADAKNGSAKLEAIDDLVANCMDEGKKVLIFSQFTSFLDLIGVRLAEHGVAFHAITGETPKRKRVELVDEFNGDDVPVFLISLKAGNTGLNLVGASVVIHADPWWNEAAQNQATDRAHRIGQTQDVNVYRIVAKDTIEERMLKLQRDKSRLARQFTDGGASSGVGSLTKDDLLDLLS